MNRFILVGLLVAAVLFIGSGNGFAERGDQLPIKLNQKPAAAPVKSAPSASPASAEKTLNVVPAAPSSLIEKPLVTQIKANPALVNQSLVGLTVPFEELRNAMDRVNKKYGAWAYIDGVPDWVENNCANKSYTAEEQKEAGCLGSDTVDACTEKLYWRCFHNSPYWGSYKKRLGEMMDAVHSLQNTAALYENGLKAAEQRAEQP